MAKKLKLYRVEDIREKEEEIKRHNAFIRSDGTFYLAKGYTGCNPSHQLDSSALQVGRQDIGVDFIEKYKENNKNIEPSLITYTDEEIQELATKLEQYEYMIKLSIKFRQERVMDRLELKRIRSILIHYYGYALFARQENVKSKSGREQVFYEESIFSNPEYYGKRATKEQMETLKELFYINDYSEIEDKKTLILIENHLASSDYWHC